MGDERFKMEEVVFMWTKQPWMAKKMYPDGLKYEIQKGDTLANLGEKFGMPWERIADATMGTSDPKEINKWLIH